MASSNNIKTIKFKLIDNPTFRIRYEFTPEYKAPTIISETAILPLPTTLIGTILAVFIDLGKISLQGINEDIVISDNTLKFKAYEKLIERALGPETKIYGPYLEYENEKFIGFSERTLNDRIIKVKHLNQSVNPDTIKQIATQVQTEVVTGIDIDPKTKTVKIGYTYYMERVILKNWSICIDLIDSKNKIDALEGKIVKLGTKGAKAIIEIDYNGENSLYFCAEKRMCKCNNMAYLLISPAILPQSKKSWKLACGSILLTAIGYSYIQNAKRPIMPLLSTGSIVKSASSHTLFFDDRYSKYGFGSMYPIFFNTKYPSNC